MGGVLTYTLEQVQKVLPSLVFDLVSIEAGMRSHFELLHGGDDECRVEVEEEKKCGQTGQDRARQGHK